MAKKLKAGQGRAAVQLDLQEAFGRGKRNDGEEEDNEAQHMDVDNDGADQKDNDIEEVTAPAAPVRSVRGSDCLF